MAKFVAGQAVENLDYDFTDFGGEEGTVPEPSTKTVNTFFKNMKNIVKEAKALSAVAKDINIEGMDDEQLMEAMSNVDENEEAAFEFQRRTIGALALLCGAEEVEDEETKEVKIVGGSPSFADLEKLPYRVLQAFSQWLMEAIKPKREAPAGPR